MIILCILSEFNKNNTAFYRSLNNYSYLCSYRQYPSSHPHRFSVRVAIAIVKKKKIKNGKNKYNKGKASDFLEPSPSLNTTRTQVHTLFVSLPS